MVSFPRTLISCAIAGFAVFSLAPATAQTSHDSSPFYGGFNIGTSNADLNIPGIDDSDTSFRIMGGYNFGRTNGLPFPLALEAYYINFGKFGPIKIDGFGADVVAPIELAPRFSLLGRLGLAYGKAKGGGVSETDTDIKFGFGAQYQLNRQMALRGEMEFYKFGDPDLDVLSIGLVVGL
jgi:OOP family OmpA-OmpF porin